MKCPHRALLVFQGAPGGSPAPPYASGEKRACVCQLRVYTCYQEVHHFLSQSNVALKFWNINATGRGHFLFSRKMLKKAGFQSFQHAYLLSLELLLLSRNHTPSAKSLASLPGPSLGLLSTDDALKLEPCFLEDSFLKRRGEDIHLPYCPPRKLRICLSMRARLGFPATRF